MQNKTRKIVVLAAVMVVVTPAGSAVKKRHLMNRGEAEITNLSRPVLWRDPGDIRSRNLFYGSGGKAHEPRREAMAFVKEDLDGTNPKFVVRDSEGVKWKVKLGVEARPEVAASRLVWAAGYFTDDDYFLGELKVEGLPRLKRGWKLVGTGGMVRNVRVKRVPKDREKLGNWRWKDEAVAGTREWNGLRVLLALINDWDLKDENNAIYEEKGERMYAVSDLGASFGTTGLAMPASRGKGNLESYRHSKFMSKATPERVWLATPSAPGFPYMFKLHDYAMRLKLRWLGREIPRGDAKWVGELLGRLSDEQIRDAFRAAGYEPEQAVAFAQVVEKRIAELNDL